MSHLLSDEDREILDSFVHESLEAIEEIEPILIELENDFEEVAAVEPETINKLFRVFHSIKGSAAFLELSLIVTITHEAETLLDLIRKHRIKLTKEHLGVLLDLCDFFRVALNHLKENTSLDKYEVYKENFVERLHGLMGLADAPEDKPDAEETPAANAAEEDETLPLSAESAGKEADQSDVEDDLEKSDMLLTADMVKQFAVESRELLDQLEQDLLDLEKKPGNKELASGAFRALHSLKGNASLFGCIDLADISHQAENFMDAVLNDEIQATPEHFSFILQILDFLRQAVDGFEQKGEVRIQGRSGILDLMKVSLGSEAPENAPKLKDSPPKKAASPKKSNKLAEKSSNRTKSTGKSARNTRKKANTSEKKPRESVNDKPDKPKEGAPDKRPLKKNVRNSTKTVSWNNETSKLDKSNPVAQITSNEVIRVDVAKLTELLDLVGEIVIAESMVSQHPDIFNMDLPNFEKAAMHLQKNIRSLQEIATSLRMIPLTGLFRKMIRLVRDVSNKISKKVELNILGGETEVDRSVIESISDPLVHIIRNALDHGIELPDLRKEIGKSPVGQIVLEAKQAGSEILIIVQDDGKGLNRDKIIMKAKDKGIVEGSGEDLSDEQVWRLIFAPGFSTAQEITDLSGRGVGMDVVLRNIEAIRGRVDIKSEENVGTTITLRIPLTTAIVDGMLMRVENAIYALPMMDIKESLQISNSDVIKMIDGEEVVNIREHLYPIMRIHEIHKLSYESRDLSEGLVVLAESSGKSICLFVDELIGQRQLVIKPLPPYIGKVPGVSGCTILGNGDICLIFDIASLYKLTEVLV